MHVDQQGIPLGVTLTCANVHYSRLISPTLATAGLARPDPTSDPPPVSYTHLDVYKRQAINSIPDQILSWKNDGYFIIGYIGQLITGKGLDILLEAFSKLVIPKKKLILLGGGAQRQDLEEIVSSLEIQNEVAFLGFRDDRLNFLKGFDIFVLPSRSEGIPRCLMEAMAAQVTVIASDIPGCTDLIKHEQTGFCLLYTSRCV